MNGMHFLRTAALAVSLLLGSAAMAQDDAESEAAQSAAYSVENTQVAVLLDDPEAAAILERLIPTVYANELFQTMGRSQTLRSIQQYEPLVLTDEKLAEIQMAFDELHATE